MVLQSSNDSTCLATALFYHKLQITTVMAAAAAIRGGGGLWHLADRRATSHAARAESRGELAQLVAGCTTCTAPAALVSDHMRDACAAAAARILA